MKKLILFALILISTVCLADSTNIDTFNPIFENQKLKNFWLYFTLIIPVLEVIVRITPTQADNSILNLIKMLLDSWIPNRKKKDGSGENTHK